VHQLACERQPDARAFDCLPFAAQPVEGLEQVRQVLRRHADAVVHHVEADLAAGLRHVDPHLSAGPVVLAGVAQEIQQYLQQPARVGNSADAKL
jgi:hypothetical protein